MTSRITSDFPTLTEANQLQSQGQQKKHNGRVVKQTNSNNNQPANDSHSTLGRNIPVEIYNNMIKHSSDEIASLKEKLAEKDNQLSVLQAQIELHKKNIAILSGPNASSDNKHLIDQIEELNRQIITKNLELASKDADIETAKRTTKTAAASNAVNDDQEVEEEIKGITQITMLKILSDIELIIRDAKALEQESAALKALAITVYRNSGYRQGGGSLPDATLMTDLGVGGMEVTLDDGKKTIKAVPIADGLYFKFIKACNSYKHLAPKAVKYIAELTFIQANGSIPLQRADAVEYFSRTLLFSPSKFEMAAKHHADLYKKCCDQLNVLTIAKRNIDTDLFDARTHSNWTYDRHYNGIGQTETDKDEKLFKFKPIDKIESPATSSTSASTSSTSKSEAVAAEKQQ